jgi:hypothetical protein
LVSLVHGLNFSSDTLIRPTYNGSTSKVNVTNLMLPILHGVRIKDGVYWWGYCHPDLRAKPDASQMCAKSRSTHIITQCIETNVTNFII